LKTSVPVNAISYSSRQQAHSGVALVIVLAFVVLLAGLATTFLTMAIAEQKLAHSSFNQEKANQLARSALSIIVGDLKQEIVAGSATNTENGITLYAPSVPGNTVPQRNGVDSTDAIPNLVRRSVRSDPIAGPGVGSRASATSSAPVESIPSRGEISLSRWNRHYLVPRPNGVTPTDTTPIAAFVAPDWVFVSSREGPVILSSPNHSITGRYAYAVYDEGGLLDLNAAGCPIIPGGIGVQFGLKGLLSFADLTVAGLSTSAVADLVGWRNYASVQPTGSFGNFVFDSASATRFLDAVLSSTTGFLNASSAVWNGRTDQMFASRQMLIAFRASTGFSPNALQNLGTFSRDSNLPTWEPAAIQRVNANFVRSDSSMAQVGEPLFRRFLLSKLSWVGRTGPNPASRASDVQRDFGLVWNSDHWAYHGSEGSPLADTIPVIDGTREPDFFQLLNFARTTGGAHPTIGEVLSLGACIIDQFDSGPGDAPTIIEYAGPPAPSPAPPNPRAYGQEITAPTPPPSVVPIILDRPFRTPGDLGYANKSLATTLDFYTAGTLDPLLLDLFTVSPANIRAGVLSLNARNSIGLAAMLAGAIKNVGSSTLLSASNARNVALDILSATSSPAGRIAAGRFELGRLTSRVQPGVIGTDEESRELISRSLAEVAQTRTWNLMIDVIAQAGAFHPQRQRCPNLSSKEKNGIGCIWRLIRVHCIYNLVEQL
jgi:Tfp pilus assembly protein PilX